MKQIVRFNELQLGDVVRLGDYAFSVGIVKQVNPPVVERPYMTSANFDMGERRIVWIGHEDVQLYTGTVELLQRNPATR